MILIELKDFETQFEFAKLLDGVEIGESNFCPVLVLLIDWAKTRNKLGSALTECGIFNQNHKKLYEKSLSFSDFVFDTLDSKLTLECFSGEIGQFIKDYIESEVYFQNLRECYKISNLWFLPNDFVGSEKLYVKIDESYRNYIENKKHHPKLNLFDDPDYVKKYRDEFNKLEKEIE